MKGLIYRDFYLMRKTLVLTIVVFLGFMFAISLVFISTYAGNLAKDEESAQMLETFYPQAYLYTGLMALLGFSAAQNDVIYKDYQSRWQLYSYTLPIDEKKAAVSKLIVRILLLVMGFVLAVIGEVVLGIAAKKGVSMEHIKNLAAMAAIVSVSFLTLPLALRSMTVGKSVMSVMKVLFIPMAAAIYGGVKFIIYCIKEAQTRYPDLQDEEALMQIIKPYGVKIMDIAKISAPFLIIGSLVLCYFWTVKELKRRRY